MGIRLNKDIVIGGILFICSMILYFFILPKEISHTRNDDIYPGFFTIALICLSFFLLIQGFLNKEKWSLQKKLTSIKGRDLYIVIFIGGITLSVWLISFVGFYIMSVIIIVGLLFYLGIRNWIKIFCLCSGFLILIYLLFEKGLRVRLPGGFL